MKKYLPVFLMIIFTAQFVTAQKRPISHDDLFNLKRVTDPQVSPDGNLIAYVITVFNKKENSSNSDIWIISINGGDPRQLTAGPGSDSQPRWSPDGREIAFTSTRSGSPQLHIIPVGGGEARKISDISTGAGGITWAPDGTILAFSSRVFPGLEGNEANKNRLEELEKNLVKAKIFDRLLYRHWNEWTHDTRSHVFTIPVSGGEAKDITPGDYDTPPISLGGSQDYVFSPDSREVCYVKNIDPVTAVSTNNDLFTVDLATGIHTMITDNPANDHSPQYSSDGRYIAYAAMRRPGFEADKLTLMLFERGSKRHTALTGELDRSVSEFIWAPDGRTIYFTANDQSRNSVYSVDIETRTVKQVTQNSYITNLSITPDGRFLACVRQSINEPSEVYKLDPRSGSSSRLTNTNDALLEELDMNPAEDFWFEGSGNTRVHGLLVKPPDFDPGRTYPMVYLVHGGPQGMWGDMFHYRWNPQMFAAPGYAVVMVNPRGSTGYGQKFTDEISGDWGGKVFEDLKKGLEYAVEQYDFINEDRLAAAGASYGGYMMNWFEAKMDEFKYKFKCLVNHDGVFNTVSMYLSTEELWFPEWEFKGVPWDKNAQDIYMKWSPSSYIRDFKTPMLIIHSELDYRVPINEGLQAFTALRKMNVPSKFLYFPDEDHFINKPLNSELWHETTLEWIAEWIGQ
ncbi:prolyl oligopeptidase family serine peptidase [candidate division KSB1 bacterium]